jgi:hypothetical protein
MRLSMSSFILPVLADPDPVDSQNRLIALMSECGDMGRAAAKLVAEAHENQRIVDQLHLNRAARDMDDAVNDIRREFDWISLGSAAKLIRIRRATLHAAVMRSEIEHRILVVRGISARHVRRCAVLDWQESRLRSRMITARTTSLAG